MTPNQIVQLARMARGLPRFLRRPLTVAEAQETLKRRMADRERRFLGAARSLIYSNPRSPYLQLLRWAGCTHGDLVQSVHTRGLDKTLETLRDEGAFVSLPEFKATVPISRRGLSLEPRESDFDSPLFDTTCIEAATSGSRSRGTRVLYDWALINEHAANELMLNAVHGVAGQPLAMWLPPLPSIAGTQYLLLNLKFRRPPERWFSQTDMRAAPLLARHRIANEYVLAACRLLGHRAPRPEHTDFTRAGAVAEWMARRSPCLGRMYTSSAVRVAREARAAGLDLSGCTILSGGEPLTDSRREFIESTGARVFGRYSATETGLIGASCDRRLDTDDMHIYMDRLAVIQEPAPEPGAPGRFLFTSLSPHASKVLLNTDIGDCGHLASRKCDCLFGRLGMDAHVSHVRSHAKFTVEGMNVLGSTLDRIIAELVVRAGGSPDDYQYWETTRAGDLRELVIAIDPSVPGIDEARFRDDVLGRLARQEPGSALAAHLWRQARTLHVIRARPELSRGHKLLPVIGKGVGARAPEPEILSQRHKGTEVGN